MFIISKNLDRHISPKVLVIRDQGLYVQAGYSAVRWDPSSWERLQLNVWWLTGWGDCQSVQDRPTAFPSALALPGRQVQHRILVHKPFHSDM